MTTRWLAFLGSALISLPFTPLSAAQTQPAPSSSTTPIKLEFVSNFSGSAPAPGLNRNLNYRNLNWSSDAVSNSTTTLTASASGSSTLQLGTSELWTAQDAIPSASAGTIDTGSETPTATRDTSNCRWSLWVSNAWSCKIKPLTRHDFPVHEVVQHLWPLHGRNSSQ